MNEKEWERNERLETARLDEMYDAKYDDSDCEYDMVKQKYEQQFLDAIVKRLVFGCRQ